MRDRRNLGMMERLLSVQQVKRASAEAALAAARSEEQEARLAEDNARSASLTAERHWLDHLARSGFSPEYGRALSALLIERETETGQAAAATLRQGEICGEKEQVWQRSEALLRHSEAATRRLRRKVMRKHEEKSLAQLGDRLTFAWSRQ